MIIAPFRAFVNKNKSHLKKSVINDIVFCFWVCYNKNITKQKEKTMNDLSLLESKLTPYTKGIVVVKSQTASTNDDAKALALSGAPHGSVVVSLSQTNGRGRLGRVFSSENGGLYFSFIVKGNLPQNPALLTITSAVATAEAIEELTHLSVGIKWVNDLWLQGKKCCGILAEGIYDGVSPRPIGAVVGIGINLSNPLPEELSAIATSLSDLGKSVSVEQMAVALLKKLTLYFEGEPILPISAYRRRSVLSGKTVMVHTPTESYQAKVLQITDDGGLMVEKDGCPLVLSAGEVTLHTQEK